MALGCPNRSFLASKFYGFERVVPKAAQEQPRAAQERPRAAQERPRAAPAVGLVVEQKMSQVGGIGR